MKVHVVNIYAFLFLFCSCIGDERDVPAKYIQPEQMKKILYEYYVADAYNAERIYRDQSLQLQKENITFYKKILDNYGVDQKRFFESMDYYTSHPKILNELTDSLNNYARRISEGKK
jgi:hypothetical protein